MEKIEVERFLNHFHQKLKVFGILYRDDRGKNQQALEELEIIPHGFHAFFLENGPIVVVGGDVNPFHGLAHR